MTKSSSSPPKRKNNYTNPQLKIERLCSGEYSPFHYYPACQAVEHRPTLTRLLRQRHLEIGIIDVLFKNNLFHGLYPLGVLCGQVVVFVNVVGQVV